MPKASSSDAAWDDFSSQSDLRLGRCLGRFLVHGLQLLGESLVACYPQSRSVSERRSVQAAVSLSQQNPLGQRFQDTLNRLFIPADPLGNLRTQEPCWVRENLLDHHALSARKFVNNRHQNALALPHNKTNRPLTVEFLPPLTAMARELDQVD